MNDREEARGGPPGGPAARARAVRIGIDVGGTFTDAVAVDDDTYELIGQVKVPTTHSAPEGVAAGIAAALQRLLAELGILPERVRFIAHGTTQATNALLEGDVVPVGVVCTGTGLEGLRARSETQVGDLELAPGKLLRTLHAFAERGRPADAIAAVRGQGARVVVAAAPFSVDDPADELEIVRIAAAQGLPATGTHEISKLYGLRIRTRTAVVNASILPRMVETADMTETSVKRAGIPAPLMIMRSDGGVMAVEEVRQRPILTILSGPAAGVAGALMYEKVSDGIFLEVGGTSTDISAIRNGRVMVEYAEVGGNKTYLTSLDVRTVGVAGGSMIRVSGLDRAGGPSPTRLIDVGPRSAHIAGLPYAVFAEPEEIVDPALELFAPRPGDPCDYVCVRSANGRRFALTTACAANLLGVVRAEHYARGNAESARRAFAPLAAALGADPDAVARRVLDLAAGKLTPVVEALRREYGLDQRNTVLVGGGGGAAVLVPPLAETIGLEHRIARNHQVISPIGVALALVREVVERTIPHPTQADILRVRREAEEAAIRAGASPSAVEVRVEVDAQRQVVRAVATGATELRAKDLLRRDLPEADLRATAARSMKVDLTAVRLVAQAGRWYVYSASAERPSLFGLVRRSERLTRVLDAEGVVRLAGGAGEAVDTRVGELREALARLVRQTTTYGDAGARLPAVFLLCGGRMADLSGLQTEEQIDAMVEVEIAGHPPDEPAAVLCLPRR